VLWLWMKVVECSAASKHKARTAASNVKAAGVAITLRFKTTRHGR
jgi:hypothetical protein